MWNTPSKEQLANIPDLYKTEDIALDDKVIFAHFFVGSCDWFMAEFNQKDVFFGFAILNGDLDMAEWGYISFDELKSIKIQGWLEVEFDCYWEPRPAREVNLIQQVRKKFFP